MFLSYLLLTGVFDPSPFGIRAVCLFSVCACPKIKSCDRNASVMTAFCALQFVSSAIRCSVVPRVLPTQQYRSCFQVSDVSIQLSFRLEVGI